MKKILSLIFILLLSVSTAATVGALSGNGSSENPFLVSTGTELIEAVDSASTANNKIVLTNHIALDAELSIEKGVTIDFAGFTLSGGIYIKNTNALVTIENGIISREWNGIEINGAENVTFQNLEISAGFGAVSAKNSTVNINNCKLSSKRQALQLNGSATVITENTDLITEDPSYKVWGCDETSNLNLNGTVQTEEYAKPGSITGGYDGAWKENYQTPPVIVGDLNRDGVVDIRDLVRMKKLLASGESLPLYADFNNDGAVNSKDLAVMKKYLLGVINTIG